MKRKHYKVLGIVVIILVLIVLYFTFRITEPDSDATRADIGSGELGDLEASQIGESIEVDKSISSFNFEGFGPGKSHLGEFTSWEAEFVIDNDEIVGVIGDIQVDSVDTGIGGLNNHLVSDDFFDVENHREISFVSSSLTESELSGNLMFRGVTKEISFPVDKTENSLVADFILDVSEFGMNSPGANPEVRIFFKLFS